ncbi:MAG TPA: ABC transporter permease [Terriglobales bacterium]|nr:ABC transporter permease [Terriglobales bacterium]
MNLVADLRYATRTLLKAPGFTAVALLTLALGIGANTAIFTLVDATILRLLPVGHPEQLALLTNPGAIGDSFGTTDGNRGELAYSEYTHIRDNNRVFTGVLAAQSGTTSSQVDWSAPGQPAAPEPASTKLVSNNYFAVLEVPAYRGRLFDANQPLAIGAEPEAVMSYAYWDQRFNRDPAVVGRDVRLHGQLFTVIGIAPPGFFGENVGDAPGLFLPLAMTPVVLPGIDRLHDPAGVSRLMWLQVMGRMQPGITLAQAQAASNVLFLQSVQQQAGAATDAAGKRELLGQRLELSPGGRGASAVRRQFGDPLLALFGLVGLVLLLAIVNLASLMLARGMARQKEIGVRLALGARRGRILRQLLTESVLLALLGGVLGAGLAFWLDPLLLRLVAPASSPITLSLTPDARVLGFVALICLLTGILFGLAPALRLSGMNPNATLQAQGRGGSGRSRHILHGLIRGGMPLGKLLVVGQVALSVVLLVGAALFVRSLRLLSQTPLGFNPEHLVSVSIDADAAGYHAEAATPFLRRVLAQLTALPGVRAAGFDDNGILTGNDCGLPLSVAGYKPPSGHPSFNARCDQVAGDIFTAAGIPLIFGRPLNPSDDFGGKNVVINQTFAKQVFAGRDPLGQQLHDTYPDDHGVVYTVVGVVADSKHNRLSEKDFPRFYMPLFNGVPGSPPTSAFALVRGAGGASLVSEIRQTLRQVAPNMPMDVTPMPELIDGSLATQQLLASLSTCFGALALLMAGIGLYGVLSYGIARRTPEIGVRMALGAGRGTVIAMVLGETAVIVLIGLLAGIPASLGGAKLVNSQMQFYGVSYYDPASLAAAVAVLAAVALLAGYLPALRASRVDPLTALRAE